MGSSLQTFEVKVMVKIKGSKHFSWNRGKYIENGIVKMFHKDARTGEQAMRKCEKYGHPISVRKVDVERIKSLPSLPLGYGLVNPYPDAIALDEMPWRRKNKRVERVLNHKRDKDSH